MSSGSLDACWNFDWRLYAFRDERTVALCVLAAMGRDGCVGDSRYVENENAEVVGRVKGNGMLLGFVAPGSLCRSLAMTSLK